MNINSLLNFLLLTSNFNLVGPLGPVQQFAANSARSGRKQR